MTTCRCQHLPSESLQQRAHAAHTRIAQLAQHHLPFVRRRKEPDPELEVLIERSRARLKALHTTGARYLPDVDISRIANFQASVTRQEAVQQRRKNEHPPHAD